MIVDTKWQSENKGHQASDCRIFISHKVEDKLYAARLKSWLANFGMDAFVAHEDIEVSDLWASSIEENLKSCNALVYICTDRANDSSWCQQEIGWALGRDIPVIAISFGAVPDAFLGRRQAMLLSNHRRLNLHNYYSAKLIRNKK